MTTDHMHCMDAEQLLSWILRDLENGSALGIVKDLFFIPQTGDPFRMERYGVMLETPLGVAAGPHTQMAQNIVAAWLCGARYMELKTVQVLDQITVAKPCIDMIDEGYNCEWSQELTLDKSYREYLNAWVLLHILHDRLGFAGAPGMIFNMSAGYSMEGILSPTVQRFLDRMQNCGDDVEALKRKLAAVYPRAAELAIPDSMSDNLTISCMHGCPPDEVERIALYFLEERKLNTTLKMNPTLLGPKCVRGILNKTLGYDVEVPDVAFEHDLPYDKAIKILTACREAADRLGLRFSVKLTNTLETSNSGRSLPASEAMVYMSGRPLHPISIALAERLQQDFGGTLDISFCAGVDALNVADTLACGLTPVTVCSDLLKPGGYGRLAQYIANLRAAMADAGAASLAAFIEARAGVSGCREAVLKNLGAYASAVTAERTRYAKPAAGNPDIKTARPLPALDCAAAPCMSACPAGQHIPAYLARAAKGDMDGSLAVILATNPFPNVLGKLCNQACRSKCVRQHYDDPLRIRDVKGCAASAGLQRPVPPRASGRTAAVVGAGPAGLSCAWFLALAGCDVDVYERSEKAGGVVLGKMAREAGRITRDVDAILALGVRLHTDTAVDETALAALCGRHDAVYLATGMAGERLNGPAPAGGAPKGAAGSNLFRQQLPGNGNGESAAPSLVASVGEGRRAAMTMLARLGIVPASRSYATAPLPLEPLRRRQAFREQSPGKVGPENAPAEAARCLQCDRYCGLCVSVCPNRANLLVPADPRAWPVQQAVATDAGVRIVTTAEGRLAQSWQVLNIGDFCNECGNCAAFCPSAGAPYRDKQRLHLSDASFDADVNGFIRRAPGRFEGKYNGEAWELTLNSDRAIYEDAHLRAVLDARSLAALKVDIKNGAASVPLFRAVDAALYCGLADNSAAFPPDAINAGETA